MEMMSWDTRIFVSETRDLPKGSARGQCTETSEWCRRGYRMVIFSLTCSGSYITPPNLFLVFFRLRRFGKELPIWLGYVRCGG